MTLAMLERPAEDQPAAIEVLVCDELALLIAAARDAAWQSHCNVLGAPYWDRKESLARLRGALLGYDRARGVV